MGERNAQCEGWRPGYGNPPGPRVYRCHNCPTCALEAECDALREDAHVLRTKLDAAKARAERLEAALKTARGALNDMGVTHGPRLSESWRHWLSEAVAAADAALRGKEESRG